MVAEIYNLSKNSSLSEYAGSTVPLPDHKENMTLKSSLHIKYLTRDPKHHFILG